MAAAGWQRRQAGSAGDGSADGMATPADGRRERQVRRWDPRAVRFPGSPPCATTTTSFSASPTRPCGPAGSTAGPSRWRPRRRATTTCCCPRATRMGIDSVAFAAGIAPLLRRMQLLLAVRMGEMWPPQLARQLATIDQMLGGRLTINIISSDLPGQDLDAEPALPPHAGDHRRAAGPAQRQAGRLPRRVRQPDARPAADAAGRRVPAVLLRRPVRGGPRGGRPGRGRVPDVARHHGRASRRCSPTCGPGPPATAASCGSATGRT